MNVRNVPSGGRGGSADDGDGSLERDWLIYGGAISAVKLNALVIKRGRKFSGSTLWVHVRMSWLVFKHVMTGLGMIPCV